MHRAPDVCPPHQLDLASGASTTLTGITGLTDEAALVSSGNLIVA
jgi:hypothetical protein